MTSLHGLFDEIGVPEHDRDAREAAVSTAEAFWMKFIDWIISLILRYLSYTLPYQIHYRANYVSFQRKCSSYFLWETNLFTYALGVGS